MAKAAVVAVALTVGVTGAALAATARPAGAIQLGWDKSSTPEMAKMAEAALAAQEKKEKEAAAAAAAAAALAAEEAEQAAEAERLLDTMGSEERQFWSIGAYAAAQGYVRRAESGSRAAAGSVRRSIGVWDTSKLDVLKAIAAVKKARATVAIYQEALKELGLAVYTGAAISNIDDISSKETQLAEAELAGVAAAATTAGLHRSQQRLTESIVNVGRARATVVVDWGKVLQAKQADKEAIAQVTLSREDVSVAKLWATVPDLAPDQPIEALALIEGRFAPGHAGHGEGTSPAGAATSPLTLLASSTRGAQADQSDGSDPAGPADQADPAGQAGQADPAFKAPADPPASLQAMAGYGPSILGPSVLSASQVTGWFESTGYHARVTVPFGQLVDDYFKAAQVTGVRPDIAFAQSVIETGYFSFPSYGQDAPGFNNFAGIGACDTCKHGWSFPSAMTGVLSQEELLEVYATPPHPTAAYGKPSSNFGIAGCCSTWMSLAGTWASAPAYGYDILNIYNEMLAWALPRDLQSAGLLGAAPVPAKVATSRPGKSSPAPSRTPPT